MIQFNLSPEDIEQLVRDSIMKAGFGQAVQKSIDEIFRGYSNPIKSELLNYVKEVTRQLLDEEPMRTAIIAKTRQVIEERVTDEFLSQCCNSVINAVLKE